MRRRSDELQSAQVVAAESQYKSFHVNQTLYQLVEELKRGDNAMDDRTLKSRVEYAVRKDFPLRHEFPTARDMDDSVARCPHPTDRVRFLQGQWAEYLGNDMRYHLAQVRRSVKLAHLAPSSSGSGNGGEGGEPKLAWSFYSYFDGDNLIPQNHIRAPEEALKRVFGMRPWLWQQYALLQTEDYCRFQEFHERDFQNMSFTQSAEILFQKWLTDARNADFRQLFHSRPKPEQDKLVHHLCAPFRLMDSISKRGKGGKGGSDGEEWDFSNANLSSYLYQSILGAGWLSCAAIFAIQWVIPAFLLFSAIKKSPKFDNLAFDAQNFCAGDGEMEGKAVNFMVLILYAMRNLPQVFLTYFETMGESTTLRSRLNAMRTLIWDRGTDTLEMAIGYRLERFMNSIYIAMSNTLMLFVLFLTSDPVEVVLNALAIEFVVYFDDEICRTQWFDPKYRYLRAGAVELVFRKEIDRDVLRCPKRLCREFNIDPEEYERVVGGSLRSVATARADDVDLKYCDPKAKVWKLAARYAQETKNQQAMYVFKEFPAHFDVMARTLHRVLGTGGTNLFEKYEEYHTWSRWDGVLFLGPCGTPAPPRLVSVREELVGKPLPEAYLNDSFEDDYDPKLRFALDIGKTLVGYNLVLSLRVGARRRNPFNVALRMVDGLLEWFSAFYLVLFPFSLVGFVVLLFACY